MYRLYLDWGSVVGWRGEYPISPLGDALRRNKEYPMTKLLSILDGGWEFVAAVR